MLPLPAAVPEGKYPGFLNVEVCAGAGKLNGDLCVGLSDFSLSAPRFLGT